MGTVTRATKASGGTNFAPNTTILSDEANDDLNTLYADYNGSIANVNISGSADIAQSKIADHGTQATQTTPGTPGAESAPTTIAGDIERLRYALAQVKFGNASDQGGALEWFERSVNLMSMPYNLLPNGSFELFTGAGGATAPNGWAVTGTPASTYAQEQNAHADNCGRGYRLKITGAGSANTGVQYTIAANSLRPSTTYLVYAMAKADAGDTARILSTGAGTNIDVETTSTSMTLLQGFFTTDATPTAVVLQLLCKGASDVTYWDHVVCIPQIATPRESGSVAVIQQMEALGTNITNTDLLPLLNATVAGTNDGVDWTDGTVSLDRQVACPGPGYIITVMARLGYDVDGTMNVRFRLVESTDGGTTWICRDRISIADITTANQPRTAMLSYIATNPTPGVVYRYKVTASNSSGGIIQPQSVAPGAGPDAANANTTSFLWIKMEKAGS
jgi:hypothetical protein